MLFVTTKVDILHEAFFYKKALLFVDIYSFFHVKDLLEKVNIITFPEIAIKEGYMPKTYLIFYEKGDDIYSDTLKKIKDFFPDIDDRAANGIKTNCYNISRKQDRQKKSHKKYLESIINDKSIMEKYPFAYKNALKEFKEFYLK